MNFLATILLVGYFIAELYHEAAIRHVSLCRPLTVSEVPTPARNILALRFRPDPDYRRTEPYFTEAVEFKCRRREHSAAYIRP